MKNTFIKLGLIAAAISLTACSSMREIKELQSYAEPKWYADCAESGVEGMFWWKEEYVYACGGGQSRFFQAGEEQMYAIAMNHYAKRINGNINSKTVIHINNDTRSTDTFISYSVTDTSIREHIAHERAKFKYKGEYYTFVKLKMEKATFDKLIAEAKARPSKVQ
tara:strand:+ start:1228 stop:1722 length:495 start_codon:yes stop_codon:yes gene_type:complete